MADPNSAWDEITTTTLANRTRRVSNNVLQNVALFSWLNSRGRVQPASGGRTLVEELSWAENSTAGWYSGYELFDITPQSVLSAAEFNWKQAYVTVSISGLEKLQNSGPEQMIDLVTARIENAENSMMNLLGAGAYSDGTGHGGKEIGGMQLLVADDPTSDVVGGIDRATFTFWQNSFLDAQGDISDATEIQGLMQNLWLKIISKPSGSPMRDAPDVGFASINPFTAFWNSMLDFQRITNADEGVSGFRSLQFNGPQGGCPVFYDPSADAAGDHLYFLNSRHIRLRPHRDRNMVVSRELRSVNQDATVQHITWAGNITANNLGRCGVLFD